jgi:antirestriction protein ArdC
MKQYQVVTDRIVAMLEAGTRPWQQDWAGSAGGRPLRSDGTPYKGMNVLNLWAAGMVRGFGSRTWMTYKTAAGLGGQVRKGAKSECAFYAGAVTREVEGSNGETSEKTIPFLKSYNVFNVDEIDGLPAQYYATAAVVARDPIARIEAAETFIGRTGAIIHHGGQRAFYRPHTDEVYMPAFDSFRTAAGYYGVMFHELAHWTGAAKRLDRTKGKIFGDPTYAFEELIAELSAAYLCADLAISAEPREDHASYIASWIKALKEDNRAVFRAAAYAEKAAAYLHGTQAEPEELAA